MGKFSLEIKWGVLFTLIALLWMTMEKMLGWHDEHLDMHAKYTLLFALVAFLVYYMALRERRQKDGGLTFKQAMISGTVISLVVMLLSPLSQYITSTIISPDYFTNAIEYSVEHGMMERSKAEAHFNLKSYMMQSTLMAPIMGIITSAIVGGLMVLLGRRK